MSSAGVLAFVDTETTGLSLEAGHSVWDIAVIHRCPGFADTEHEWFVKPDLSMADPGALRINRYYERTREFHLPRSRKPGTCWSQPEAAAAEMAALTSGAVLVGANVGSFDAPFIDAFLRTHGHCSAWDYHFRDIGSLVTGYAAGVRAVGGFYASGESRVARWPASPKLTDMARAVGIDPDGYKAHEALDDCRLVRDIWDRVMGGEAR